MICIFQDIKLVFLWLRLFLNVCVCMQTCAILFDALINTVVFLISFLDCSLLLYRNAINFCILILYPATFLNLFTYYKTLLLIKSSVLNCYVNCSVFSGLLLAYLVSSCWHSLLTWSIKSLPTTVVELAFSLFSCQFCFIHFGALL